uniref:Uncharacterized protein n=1 Tax=Phlebotomus papatasi TaxID=29031 RepID=A0A1B0D7T4_PHLPP
MTEERLDDESFPISERLDYSDKRDEVEDKTECVEDDHNLIKTDDESETGETKQAKFYIGESSTNIITKSQTERRSDFAFDNDGFRTTEDSMTMEEETSISKTATSKLEKDQRTTVEKRDDFDKLVRCEAIHLVDSVLEQSLSIVHSQQQPQCLTDGGQSESEHFAITSDISNGVDFVKSPTIESISGKSFDDDNQYEGIDQAVVDAKATRIDRRFERLSSQLDEQELNDDVCQLEFEHAMAAIDRDEVSQLQSDFSKMSWDESVSATTAEHALSTPDTDLQDLNQEPRRDPDTLPKPTPRLSKSITEESGEVSSSVATEEVAEKTFSEKKVFWESLESPKDGEKLLEEVAKGARAAPIPKPRVQLSTSLSKGEESSEAPSLKPCGFITFLKYYMILYTK